MNRSTPLRMTAALLAGTLVAGVLAQTAHSVDVGDPDRPPGALLGRLIPGERFQETLRGLDDFGPPAPATAGVVSPRSVQPILFTDFESIPVQDPISPYDFIEVLGGGQTKTGPYDDTSIIDDPEMGHVIRTRLDGDSYRSEPDGNNGTVLFPQLSRTVDSACVSYDIRFDENFQFDLGGKLPGLEGVRPGVDPGVPAGGGNPGDQGWSARGMWLGPEAYSWANPEGFGVAYMYSPEMKSEYGDNLQWDRAYQQGVWHKVKHCQTMNTVGEADGIEKAYFDGELVFEDREYVFRLRDDVHVNYLMWSIFRGGGDMEWAASNTGYIDIDNVLVTEVENVAPSADFTAVVDGLNAEFTADAKDPDGRIATHLWDFGDGTSSTDVNAVHDYTSAGTYPVKLTVTDHEGAQFSVTKEITATGPATNQPPVAQFGVTVTNLSAKFVSTSTDADGTISSLLWNFGDGETSTSASPTHTYDAPGTYQATLTVTDNGGITHSTAKPVTVTTQTVLAEDGFDRSVSNGLGTADVGGAWTVTGDPSQFRAATSSGQITMRTPGTVPRAALGPVADADTDSTVRFSLDRIPGGDGAFVSLSSRANTEANTGYRAKVRVASDGALTLYLTRAFAGIESTLATVPLPASQSYAVGDSLQIRLQTHGTSPTALRARVWHVGSSEPTTWQITASDATEPLQDTRGVALLAHLSSSAPVSSVIARFDNLKVVGPVGNQAPDVGFSSLVANRAVSFTSTSSDPDGTITGYLWDFGDGTTSTEANPAHLYASADTYRVTLTVTDDQGSAATRSEEVTTWPPTIALPQPLLLDTFSRGVTGGWGSASDGSPWTVTGGDSLFSVASGNGEITANAGKGPRATNTTVIEGGTDTRARLGVDKVPAGTLYLSLSTRAAADGNDSYRAKLKLESGGAVTLSIVRISGGVETTIATGVKLSGVTMSPETPVVVRLQAEGASPTTVRAKAWQSGAAEPSSWTVTATDSTAALQGSGRTGISPYLSSSVTNGPIVITADNLVVLPLQ